MSDKKMYEKLRTIKGLGAIEFANNNLGILSLKISEIRIYEERELLNISIRLSKDDVVCELIFNQVLEYSFYYSDKYIFSTIEDYKLLHDDDRLEFYLSLDPYDSENKNNMKDQDFIRSKELRIKY
ncbi:hypothetical protein EYV94_18440 [Puteibacter caeruleilacunae]|nr:hypothetical protein EYV94_18440 [Puteibacter caeruleilacunae]